MNVDLGSPVLDVAIGLSFVFFLLSVISANVTEGLSGLMKWRSKTLEKGIRGMLGDDGTANDVWSHPLVQTELDAGKKRGPSYLSPRNFALALLDVLTKDAGNGSQGTLRSVDAKIGRIGIDSDLSRQLRPLLAEADASTVRFRRSLEQWFDDSMDRVSGWYKRKSQIATIAVAVVVTLALNASAVRVVERLSTDPAVRTAVAAQAQAQATVEAGDAGAEAKQQVGEGTSLKAAGQGVESAYKDLEALKLPLLWGGENVPAWNVGAVVTTLIGWLITILAISLGAPFWFDALGKLSRLKNTGKKPEPEK